MEVCQRIIEFQAEGLSYGEIVKALSGIYVSKSTVGYTTRRFNMTKRI